MRFFSPKQPLIPVLLLMAAHFALILTLALAKHWSGMSSLSDLGVHDQALWTFNHLGAPLSTLNAPYETSPRFGWHFSPIILALSPLYWLGLPVESLIVAYCLAITLSAWPLYATLETLKAKSSATIPVLAFVAIYLFNPFLLNAAMWGFRESGLALPILTFALWAVVAQRFGMLVLASLLLILCKEHYGAAVGGLGLFWAVRHRDWGRGLGLAVFGVAMAAWIVLTIMPALSGALQHPMTEGSDAVTSRYGWVAEHPDRILPTLFSAESWQYALLLITPFLLMPVLAPFALLAGAADMGINLLSANPIQRSIFSYHSMTLVPVLTLAAAIGMQRLRKSRLTPTRLACGMLGATLALSWYFSPYPLPGSADPWKLKAWRLARPQAVAEISKVLGDAPIAAQVNIGSYFSGRAIVTPFPHVSDDTRFIVLNITSPVLKPSYAPFGLPYGLPNEEYIEHAEYYLRSNKWSIAYWQDPWLVYERDGEDKADKSAVRNVLLALKLLLLPEESMGNPDDNTTDEAP